MSLMKKVSLFITIILLTTFSFNFVLGADEMNQTIKISNLTLKEKIGQLIIVKPEKLDERYLTELHIGGIFLNNKKSAHEYSDTIEFYQNNSKIKLFVATDMEGYWNPFNFYTSKSFGDIQDDQEAYDLGVEHSKILSELGFNMDFSPIVEVRNNVWPGRSFTGNSEEVKEKISAYIQGLHKYEILATAKHYPGGSMIKNPHVKKYKTEIFDSDLEYFDYAIEQKVDAIMVGHPVVYGAVDSKCKQSTVSREVIGGLRDKFEGLIITDAVTMMGLRISYLFNFKKVYPILISAGNDIILDTHKHAGYRAIKKRLHEIEKAVDKGYLSEELIDKRVKKILEAKGYFVID